MTTKNEMKIETLCHDGCSLDTSSFTKTAGSVASAALTGVTSTAAELNQLHSQGAVTTDFAKLHAATGTKIASGTAGTHVTDLKVNYTTLDLDTEAEIIAAINTTNAAINALLARNEAFGINASS